MKQQSRHLLWAFGKLLIVTGALAFLGWLAWRYNMTLGEVKDYLASIRTLPAVFFFIFAYGFVSIVPLPGARDALKLAGALRFGFIGSVILVWAGEMIAAAASFPLGRWGGKDLLDRLLGRQLASLNERIAGADWRSIVFLRVLPIVPYRYFNFASGLVDLNYLTYLGGSAVGILLRTAFFQFLFTVLMDTMVDAGITTAQIYIFTLILVPVMLLCFWLYTKKRNAKHEHDEQ